MRKATHPTVPRGLLVSGDAYDDPERPASEKSDASDRGKRPASELNASDEIERTASEKSDASDDGEARL